MTDFLPIGDHGVIGDMRTAALVGRNGAMDWFCAPRFDSPSLFAALLDPERGGAWRIQPVGHWTSEQRYLPATNILVTAFHVDGGGVVQVTDFMPAGPARGDHVEVYRRVDCPRGAVDVETVFQPRFDYAIRATVLARRAAGVIATDQDNDAAGLSTSTVLPWEVADGTATARWGMTAEQAVWFVLRFDEDEVHPVNAEAAQRALDDTAHWWDGWASQMGYRGPYALEVQRSALALRLCCYEPSGAFVAAPTTSLPEDLDGVRNWDYRYSWLRDSAFVFYALDRVGFRAAAERFLRFLKRVCRRADGRHIQIMYTVDGGRQMPEQELGHLRGYRGAQPVRIGNDAAGQFQLDVYGELLDTVALARTGHDVSEGLWKVIRDLVDWTAAHWREPDFSIWEARQELKQYVFSKVMAWVALERGCQLATLLQQPGPVDRWREEAEAIHAEVLERGWDPARNTFVQAYGEPQLDASLLIIPKVGFLKHDDPRVRSTLAAIRRELATSCEELVYRYRSPDGLSGDEGAFVACSFWMVQNLAMIGEFAEAERLFKNQLRRANHLGLLAEEIDPASGEQLGNFPLALSHAALINTAYLLEELRPRAPG